MNDWEIAKVIAELDKINQGKMEDHASIQQELADVYEAPWEEQATLKSATTGIKQLHEVIVSGGCLHLFLFKLFNFT